MMNSFSSWIAFRLLLTKQPTNGWSLHSANKARPFGLVSSSRKSPSNQRKKLSKPVGGNGGIEFSKVRRQDIASTLKNRIEFRQTKKERYRFDFWLWSLEKSWSSSSLLQLTVLSIGQCPMFLFFRLLNLAVPTQSSPSLMLSAATG